VSENRAITDDSDGSRPNKKRRRWKRRLFASKCFAYFQNGHNASWCSIANISPSGARIRGLRPNETLPDRMTLVFSDRGLIERDCKRTQLSGKRHQSMVKTENHTCRNLVPTFPQRSPPSLLTTAACGGSRSTPDCRPRKALLHLSYSYAAPCGPALLVTQVRPPALPGDI
jgi:hypothetical protein